MFFDFDCVVADILWQDQDGSRSAFDNIIRIRDIGQRESMGRYVGLQDIPPLLGNAVASCEVAFVKESGDAEDEFWDVPD